MNEDKEIIEDKPFGTLFSRLSRGAGAQVYGQGVQMFIRLAEVPLLLSFWSPELYGEWLILSAIPAYLSMGDIGFSTTAAREMTMLNSANDKEGTLRVFQSTWILLLMLSGFIFAGMVFFVYLAPLDNWLGLQQISSVSLRIIILVLAVDVLLGFQAGLLNGSLWAVGRYPLGIGLSATMQLLGFLGLALGLVIKNAPVSAAFGYLVGKSISFFILLIAQKRNISWLSYGFRYAKLEEIRRLAAPSFASLAFPLGNAFNIQGLRMIIGITLGPTAVAVFVPLRTLANFAMQPRRIVNQLLQPELGLAYGSQNKELFKKLVLRACQLSFWSSTSIALILGISGEQILSRWTVGKIPMHWPLYLFLLLSVIINSLWYTALMVPYATNRHAPIALLYFVIYGVAAFLLAYIFSLVYSINGIGISLVIVEMIMAVFVIREALKLSTISSHEWLAVTFRPPFDLINKTYDIAMNFLKKSIVKQKR